MMMTEWGSSSATSCNFCKFKACCINFKTVVSIKAGVNMSHYYWRLIWLGNECRLDSHLRKNVKGVSETRQVKEVILRGSGALMKWLCKFTDMCIRGVQYMYEQIWIIYDWMCQLLLSVVLPPLVAEHTATNSATISVVSRFVFKHSHLPKVSESGTWNTLDKNISDTWTFTKQLA